MSLAYLTSQETPVFKFKENSAGGAATAWTPSTSTKVGITSITVGNATGSSGTFQIRFGNTGGVVVAAGALTGSTTVNITFPSPAVSFSYDQAVFFDTATSQSNGGWTAALTGFEYGGN